MAANGTPFFKRRWVKWTLLGGGGLAVAGLVTFGISWWWLSRDVDSFMTLFALRTPKTISKVLDVNGNVIGIFAEENRELIPYGDIPKAFVNALVATEDADFWSHSGISARGMARAGLTFVGSGFRRAEGASTLTMQLVRNVTSKRKKRLDRKLKEIILARELEKRYTKQQIMEQYANEVYFGGGVYGIEAASKYYFGKSAPQLGIEECAMLAGLVQNPNGYNPYVSAKSRNLAKVRRDHVLRRMVAEDYLKDADAKVLAEKPIKLARENAHEEAIAAYAVEEVRKYLYDKYGKDAVLSGGLEVTTTLDAAWQEAAEDAIRTGLRAVERRRGFRKEALQYLDDPEKGQLPGWNRYLEEGELVRGAILGWTAKGKGSVATVRVGKHEVQVPESAFAWAGKDISKLLPRGAAPLFMVKAAEDGVPTELELDQEPQVQGALMALDPKTGEIRAMVGGYDFERSKFDRAMQAERQVGSTMKAFVYGAAFEKGFTPATIVNDVPTRFLDSANYAVLTLPDGRTEVKTLRGGGKPYEPKNYEHNFWGPIPVWEAIRDSRNIPAVRTLSMVGAQAVTDFARRCGIEGDVPPYPSMALGSADLTLKEMTRAYATIGNMGLKAPEPFLIKKVVDRMGNTLEQHATEQLEQVVDKATAFQLIQCFQGVAQRGTGSRTNALNWPVAGKTGTTDDHTDAWFIGFSTRIACGVWVGLDEKKTIYRGADGGKVAVPIWTDFMKAVLPSTPREDFKAPEGMEWAEIDHLTGLLAGGGSGDILKLAFKPGTLPTSGSDEEAVKKINEARAAAPTQPQENILWGRPSGVPPMPDQTPNLGGNDPNK